jgi:hypothetical protein
LYFVDIMDVARIPNPAKADGKPAVLATSAGAAAIEIVQSVAITVHQATNIFDPVTVDGRLADSSRALTFNKLIGVALNAAIDNGTVNVLVSGRIQNDGWAWTEGDLIFLNGTSLATVPPTSGYVQQVGAASSPVSIIVRAGPPIML